MDGPYRARYVRTVITRLEIENFKAIKKVAVDLTPLTVLVGPNDSGKSTLLQVLEMLARSVTMPLWAPDGESVLDRPPEEVLFNRDVTRTARITVSGRVPGAEDHLPAGSDEYVYSIAFAFSGGVFRFVDELFHWNGKSQFTHDFQKSSVAGFGSGPNHWDGRFTVFSTFFRSKADRPLACLREELDSFLVTFDASRLRAPSAATDTLSSSGKGLSGTVDQLLTAMDRAPLEAFENALRRISPHVQGVATRPVNISLPGGSWTPGKEVWFSLRGTKKGFSAQEASTGLVLVAGYLALLHGTAHRRFLVEEPETGVHPNAALAVVDVLREMVAAGRQVITTTHSPIVLNYMEPEDVQIVTRTAEAGVIVTPMIKSRFFDERIQKFDLGELWYSVGEDALVSPAS